MKSKMKLILILLIFIWGWGSNQDLTYAYQANECAKTISTNVFPNYPFTALEWSPDGSRLAVGTPCGVELYDDNFAEVGLLPIQTEGGQISSIAWNPTDSLLAVDEVKLGLHNHSETTVIWDTRTDHVKTRLDTGSYTPILWNPTGTEVVIGSYAGQFDFWDVSSRTIASSLRAENPYNDYLPNAPITVCWSADGKRTVAVFDLTTYFVDTSAFHVESQQEHSNIAWMTADCDSTGSLLATDGGSVENLITGVTYNPAKTINTSDGCDILNVTGVAVSWQPDDKKFAVNCNDKTVRIFDPQAHLLVKLDSGLTDSSGNYQDSIGWSPDGTLLGATANDGKIRIWDTETFKLVHEITY